MRAKRLDNPGLKLLDSCIALYLIICIVFQLQSPGLKFPAKYEVIPNLSRNASGKAPGLHTTAA